MSQANPDHDPAIEVQDLTRTYGDVTALGGVSFTVRRGSILGLLGPNGSGKTTTVSVLATLQKPTSGTVRVCGHDVVADAPRVRELISLTGQYASLDDALPARQNLLLFGRLTGLRGHELTERVDTLVDRFDMGSFRDRRVSALSGGQRRRVDIACALVTRPEVLFLDEPTTGLDPRSRTAVWEAVAELRTEGITVLLTTQYLEEADRLADDIVMLGGGHVVATGTPGQLKSQAGAAVCEFTLVDRARSAEVPAALDGMEVLERDEAGDTPGAVHPKVVVRAPDGPATVSAVIDRLEHAGIDVVEIGLRQPSLDEVFMQLTEAGR